MVRAYALSTVSRYVTHVESEREAADARVADIAAEAEAARINFGMHHVSIPSQPFFSQPLFRSGKSERARVQQSERGTETDIFASIVTVCASVAFEPNTHYHNSSYSSHIPHALFSWHLHVDTQFAELEKRAMTADDRARAKAELYAALLLKQQQTGSCP